MPRYVRSSLVRLPYLLISSERSSLCKLASVEIRSVLNFGIRLEFFLVRIQESLNRIFHSYARSMVSPRTASFSVLSQLVTERTYSSIRQTTSTMCRGPW